MPDGDTGYSDATVVVDAVAEAKALADGHADNVTRLVALEKFATDVVLFLTHHFPAQSTPTAPVTKAS